MTNNTDDTIEIYNKENSEKKIEPLSELIIEVYKYKYKDILINLDFVIDVFLKPHVN